MSDRILNAYRHRSSVLHRLPALWKLVGTLCFILAVVLLPRTAWAGYLVAGAWLVVLVLVSQVGVREVLLRLLMLEPFVVGVALLSLFQPHGLLVFVGMLVKSTLCLGCMVVLGATTRFTEILRALRQLHVPVLLVSTIALMHRYLFLILEESARLLRARRSRAFDMRRRVIWRDTAAVAGQLFVRASDRAERIYAAMCARGWSE